MITLSDFVGSINEAGRGRPRKNPELPPVEKDETFKAKNKKEASVTKNSGGLDWGVNEPKSDTPVKKVKLVKDQLDKNQKRLAAKFAKGEDFFIQGRAGWGKTSVIEDMAHKYGREVVTVYLDKAVATDLGGIPIPVKKGDKSVQDMAMPAWARVMLDNPDKQFLLFFDEMNQAAPDVMNALMPIVLKKSICDIEFNNYIVGAAGNFEDENGAVEELSGPLKSRFKPLIIWETGGDAWIQAFKYLHKKWDDILGEKLVSEFEKECNIFDNPREIEHKVFKGFKNLKESGDADLFDVEDIYDDLVRTAKSALSRSEEAELQRLAEIAYKYINDIIDEEPNRRSKGQDMVTDTMRKNIMCAMRDGYIPQEEDGEIIKYGISRENIISVFCEEEINDDVVNAEMLDRIIAKLEEDGVKFKYETNDEWKKAGYKDPYED